MRVREKDRIVYYSGPRRGVSPAVLQGFREGLALLSGPPPRATRAPGATRAGWVMHSKFSSPLKSKVGEVHVLGGEARQPRRLRGRFADLALALGGQHPSGRS